MRIVAFLAALIFTGLVVTIVAAYGSETLHVMNAIKTPVLVLTIIVLAFKVRKLRQREQAETVVGSN